MEPTKPKISVKDFFLNLGATVALYTVVVTLVNLLFTVINSAYPIITTNYYNTGSSTISWSVAILVVFTPILILLMWLLEKQYISEPERMTGGIHKWLTYLTLFVSGFAIAGDLITVLYYFIDGQELDTAFILKCLVLLVVASSLFGYYLTDIRGKLTHKLRITWRVLSIAIVVASIVWGFAVLGSPRTQRLARYDEQKVNDLMNIDSAVQSFYTIQKVLPKDLKELSSVSYYVSTIDPQSKLSYVYSVKSLSTYELCAEFNNDSSDKTVMAQTYPYGGGSWTHSAGNYCFKKTISFPVNPGVKGAM